MTSAKKNKQELPVIFLPGGGMDPLCYRPLLEKLGGQERIHAVNYLDLRAEDFKETVDMVKQSIESLEAEKVILIGHSFGGAVACALTEEMQSVAKAILIEPAIFDIPDEVPNILVKLVRKANLGIIKYPRLYSFYFKVNMLIGFNLMLHPFEMTNHISQAFKTIIDPVVYEKQDPRIHILFSADDEFYPREYLAGERSKFKLIRKGNHDWLMEDPDKTATMINRIIASD